MSLRRDPFEQMESMFEQMRRDALGSLRDGGHPALARGDSREASVDDGRTVDDGNAVEHGRTGPSKVSIEERDGGYVLLADLQGFEREELDVSFEDGVLTVSATHEEGDGPEYRARSVHESVAVPADVESDDIEATYRNGVLEVTLPAAADSDDGHVIDIE